MLHRSRGALPALGVVVLAAALALGACSSGPDRRFAADTVRKADVVERINAPGTLQAAAQADLTAPAAGEVDRLPVADGARVRQGQVVAQLSSSQVAAQLRQARSALAAASSLGSVVPTLPTGSALSLLEDVQSQIASTTDAVLTALRGVVPTLPAPQRARFVDQLDQAQERVAKAQQLADQTVREAVATADQQTEAVRRSVEAATAAQRAQAALALEVAQSQQQRLTLRAPVAGMVQLGRSGTGTGGGGGLATLPSLPAGAEQALQGLTGSGSAGGQTGPVLRTGSQVSAGQTVATVYDVASLTVATSVDETDVALVKVGQPARVELDAFPGARFAGRVRRVAVAPSSSGQSASGGVTYEVDLALGEVLQAGEDAARPTPRVGMTATAEIEVRQARGALAVPGSALVGRAGGQAVYVIEGGKVHLRPVRVAADGDDRVAVAGGLRDGERVVSRGAERLRDGQDWPGS
jgi:HlyD family secretion protein